MTFFPYGVDMPVGSTGYLPTGSDDFPAVIHALPTGMPAFLTEMPVPERREPTFPSFLAIPGIETDRRVAGGRSFLAG